MTKTGKRIGVFFLSIAMALATVAAFVPVQTVLADTAGTNTVTSAEVTVKDASGDRTKEIKTLSDAIKGTVIGVYELTKNDGVEKGSDGLYSATISGLSVAAGDPVVALHYADSKWSPVTVSAVAAGSVTIKTDSFSPFAFIKSKVDPAVFGAWTKKGGFDAKIVNSVTKTVIGNAQDGLDAGKIIMTGASGAKISVVAGDDKENIEENGITPAVKEFVKNYIKLVNGEDVKGKGTSADIAGIYYFTLKADEPGDITFKLQEEALEGMGDDGYCIVLHYTGKTEDEDGITAQYVKVTSAGKLTAHFNSYSPVAIIVTTLSSAQTLVNTYNHAIGSDEIGLTPAAEVTQPTTTVVTPETTVTVPEATETPAVEYYSAYTGGGHSIVDALKAVGESNTSKSFRAQIAAANDITGYSGTAAQNIAMLQLLKSGQLKKP